MGKVKVLVVKACFASLMAPVNLVGIYQLRKEKENIVQMLFILEFDLFSLNVSFLSLCLQVLSLKKTMGATVPMSTEYTVPIATQF